MNEKDMREGVNIALDASKSMGRETTVDVIMALFQDFERFAKEDKSKDSTVYEGNLEYGNSANGYYYEWADIDGVSFVHMLDELYRTDDWKFTSKPRKVRVTIERLDD